MVTAVAKNGTIVSKPSKPLTITIELTPPPAPTLAVSKGGRAVTIKGQVPSKNALVFARRSDKGNRYSGAIGFARLGTRMSAAGPEKCGSHSLQE